MKTLLAESIIVYRSKLEQQQDEGMQQFLDGVASLIVNYPYWCILFVVIVILIIIFFNKKSR
jgi:CHASE3 domain sensor protein